jgi:hypothetical protein
MVPSEVDAFGREVARRLAALLGTGFVGAYYLGSIALDAYVAGESDIDIAAVSEERIPDGMKSSIADALLDAARDCPTRGLEFTLYRRELVVSSPGEADFEVNVNGGPRMATEVHFEWKREPSFWFVIDRAIAHRSGVTIDGPPPSQLFADTPRSMLLEAMVASMRWHRAHEGATLYSVLNASRAWRFAVDDVLGSKLAGGAWARDRWPRPDLIDAAVALRHGHPADLEPGAVDDYLAHVEAELQRAVPAPPF